MYSQGDNNSLSEHFFSEGLNFFKFDNFLELPTLQNRMVDTTEKTVQLLDNMKARLFSLNRIYVNIIFLFNIFYLQYYKVDIR